MASTFSIELHSLLSARHDDIASARGVKGVNDRVDAITLLVRDALRHSSLCFIGGGDFHYFNGMFYERADKLSILADLSNVLVDLGFSPTDVRRMGEMPLSVVVERSYAPNPFLLCFNNGILEVRGLEFGDINPRRIVTERMPYDYDPEAKCPAWETFLAEVLPDPSVRLVLQEFFGMCYLDRSRMSVEKFLLLIGAGANGKSVIFEVMKKAIGDDNVSTFDSQQLTSEKMIPYVKGKRLNFAPDMRRTSDFDSSLKALASGQDVAGRKIYGDAEKIKCPPLVFAMNEMPRFNDTTDAFFRRLVPIRFDITIPPERQDKHLVRKITDSDLPGIFNWIIEGRNRLVRQGGEFTRSEAIESYSKELRTIIDARQAPVRTYLASRGLSVYPLYDGQTTVKVSQREIALGVGDISPTAITREMNRYGVAMHRSREIFYRVYQI
jgi:putative DNA primase/helicase